MAKDFPIVGIGASAGGLESHTELLQSIKKTSNIAFVIIQHLDPKHTSLLSELLSRSTNMPISQITEGTKVKPNNVYVIPPNSNLVIKQGVLHLKPREASPKISMPIDNFFRSLAKDQGERSIGVILSGTGLDGSSGLKEIKAAGGITFVQDPKTAKYNGMPFAAINHAEIDFVLPIREIAQELNRINSHPYMMNKEKIKSQISADREKVIFDKIIIILRNVFGVDFTYYKQSTVQRRLARRMILNRIDKLEEYFNLLEKNRSEIKALFDDILINVTSFFREIEAFDALKKVVFPAILKNKDPSDPIRIWLPGVSTGQEAYSISIALIEFLEKQAIKPPIQIFATDVNEKLIQKARSGIYPQNIEAEVSKERLQRFFVKIDSVYQVNKQLREICIFAPHNILKDPPFSNLDLVSFRNVLIYFEPKLQQKVVSTIHYSLKPTGFIMLGPSETVGNFSSLFSPIDKKNKIFSKKVGKSKIQLPLRQQPELKIKDFNFKPSKDVLKKTKEFDVVEEANNIILSEYSPAAVIVNEDLEILQFKGHTSPYLEPAPGKASLNLLKMAREDLFLELRPVINRAKKSKSTAQKDGLSVKLNGTTKHFSLEVRPITAHTGEIFFIILFKEEQAKSISKAAPKKDARSKEIIAIKKELAETQDYLQSIIEERERTNEELRAASEEAQSSNEELQSVNEELETAKEELQSTNEELITVNEELHNRNIELSSLNNDYTNLLASADIPIVTLDRDLRIRSATPQSEKALNIISSDVGRKIRDIKLRIDVPNLDDLVLDVIDNVKPKKIDVKDTNNIWFTLSIKPYMTIDKKIEGAVLTFVNINDLKLNLEKLQLNSYYRKTLNNINTAIALSKTNFKQMITKVLIMSAEAMDTNSVVIFLPKGKLWDPVYSHFPFKSKNKLFTNKEIPKVALAAKGNEIVTAKYSSSNEKAKYLENVHNFHTSINIPLIAKKKTLGVLSFYYAKSANITELQKDFASTLSHLLALAIDNMRLYNYEIQAKKIAESELYDSSVMLKASRTLTQINTTPQLFKELKVIASKISDRQRVSIGIFDINNLKYKVKASTKSLLPPKTELSFSDLPAVFRKAMIDKKQPIVVDCDKDFSSTEKKHFIGREKMLLLYIPIVVSGKIYANITIEEPDKKNIFLERDIKLLEAIAVQASLVISRIETKAANSEGEK